MFPWFTIAKYGIPLLIAGMIGFGGAWKIQGVRLSVAKANFASCSSANVENTATIEQLKKQAESSSKSCQERLASKDSTIKKLKEIDGLRGKDETNPSSGDPLRDALNGMFGNK